MKYLLTMVTAACRAGEEAVEDESYRLEGEDRGHGAFTFSLLQGLQGATADTKGVVWLTTLLSHVSKEVPRLTRGEQHSHAQVQGTDIPLFELPPTVVELTNLGQIKKDAQ